MIGSLIGQTLTDPRGAIQRLCALNLSRPVLWQALMLMVVVSVLAIEVSAMISPPVGDGSAETQAILALLDRPAILVLAEGSALVLMVFAVHWVGRMFGGQGRFEQAILVVAWLQAIMLLAQVAQIVLVAVAPVLAGLVFIAVVGLYFWLLTMFVSEIHGFENPLAVLAGIIGTMIGAIIGLSVFLTLILVIFMGGVPANV